MSIDALSRVDPVLRERYRTMRQRFASFVPSNYDIADRCNLRCEGCLYFEGSDRLSQSDNGSVNEWDQLFAAEAARGVTFAYLAGAEPTLELDRIRAARRHIPHGVIFTNGTRRVPDDIDYRIHVSIWGAPDDNVRLRGADNGAKAIAHYAGDPRAVFVFTISAGNIEGIYPTAARLAAHGLPLTFSYFSPTTDYLTKLARGNAPTPYFRASRPDAMRLDERALTRAGHEIARALADFPTTVRYSLEYDAWVTGDALYAIDPATGIATDCGNRLTPRHLHIGVGRTSSAGKCCSPNIDCGQCRAYAQGYSTYLKRVGQFRRDPVAFAGWIAVLELWAGLFLPEPPRA